MPSPGDERIILEFVTRGDYVKVTAIDPESGIEAAIVGSRRMSQAHLSQVAVRKLRYVMEKKTGL